MKTNSSKVEVRAGQQVWIVEAALSEGIRTGFISSAICVTRGLVKVMFNENPPKSGYFWTRNLYASEGMARAVAEVQRDRRIKSLQKQIAKLEQLKF